VLEMQRDTVLTEDKTLLIPIRSLPFFSFEGKLGKRIEGSKNLKQGGRKMISFEKEA